MKIQMWWECPACKKENKQICLKPKPFQKVRINVKCGLCESEFVMLAHRPLDGSNKIGYTFLSGPTHALSEKEIDDLLTSVKTE